MKIPVYIIAGPEAMGIEQTGNSFSGHCIIENENDVFVWPELLDNICINPRNLDTITEKYSINRVLIVDRIQGTNAIHGIVDHINASGYNFLIGVTPEGNKPRFPDVSNIFKSIDLLPQAIVKTVGPARFSTATKEKEIISEGIGLVAPVVAYSGVRVYGIGVPKEVKYPFSSIEKIKKQLEIRSEASKYSN